MLSKKREPLRCSLENRKYNFCCRIGMTESIKKFAQLWIALSAIWKHYFYTIMFMEELFIFVQRHRADWLDMVTEVGRSTRKWTRKMIPIVHLPPLYREIKMFSHGKSCVVHGNIILYGNNFLWWALSQFKARTSYWFVPLWLIQFTVPTQRCRVIITKY